MADRLHYCDSQTLVTIEAYRAKSIYKASAFIEIGKDSPTVRSAASGMVIQADDDLYYPQLSINTNLFRLTSEPLLEEVVVDLKLDQNPKFVEPTRRSFWEAVQTVLNRATFIHDADDERLIHEYRTVCRPDSAA